MTENKGKVELIKDYPHFKKGLRCDILKENNFLNRKTFELQIEGTDTRFTVTEEELANEFKLINTSAELVESMMRKITDQIYRLRAGKYFDVQFRNHYFRINAINILKNNGNHLYPTTIISFDDDTHIISKPTDSTKDLVEKFFNKVKSLAMLTEKDLTSVSDIESYSY